MSSYTPPQDEISFFRVLLAILIFSIPFYPFTTGSRREESDWPILPRFPVLGALWLCARGDICKKCLEWSTELRSAIISVKLGTSDEILVVSGAGAARELLMINESSMRTRKARCLDPVELVLAQSLIPMMPTTPPVWIQRKIIIDTVHKKTDGPGSSIDKATQAFIKEIQRLVLAYPNQPVDLKCVLNDCSAICAINIGFGLSLSLEDLKSRPEAKNSCEKTKAILKMFRITEPTLHFPGLVSLLWWRTNRLKARAHSYAQELFDSNAALYELAKGLAVTKGEDALDTSIAKTLLTGGLTFELSQAQRYCLAGTCMAAALVSTSNLLHSVIGCLAAHPYWQMRAQQEVDGYVKDHSMASSNEFLPRLEKNIVRNLPILKAIVDEVLRLFPVFGWFARLADEDIHLNSGKVIKQGQELCFMYQNINRDPQMFDSPENFDPSRFMRLNNPASTNSKVIWPKFGHSSFGGGRRSCPAADFSMNQVVCFAARMLYYFEVRFHDENQTGLANIKYSCPGLESQIKLPGIFFSCRRDLVSPIQEASL